MGCGCLGVGVCILLLGRLACPDGLSRRGRISLADIWPFAGTVFFSNTFVGTSLRSGHHDLCTTHGASDAPAASRIDSRWVGSHEHVLGEAAGKLGGDVDLVVAKGDESAVAG